MKTISIALSILIVIISYQYAQIEISPINGKVMACHDNTIYHYDSRLKAMLNIDGRVKDLLGCGE
jgi:hypothetical protein